MKLSPKLKQQAARFFRLFAFAFVPSVVTLYHTHALTQSAVVAAAVGALEVTWRVFFPNEVLSAETDTQTKS